MRLRHHFRDETGSNVFSGNLDRLLLYSEGFLVAALHYNATRSIDWFHILDESRLEAMPFALKE
jgi:hypothetical protein